LAAGLDLPAVPSAAPELDGVDALESLLLIAGVADLAPDDSELLSFLSAGAAGSACAIPLNANAASAAAATRYLDMITP
jgi:hypothetical protein